MNEQPYPYIRAWGQMLGSYAYYINDQVAKAQRDRAPEDAIYERDGTWVRFDDITSETTKSKLRRILGEGA